MLNNLYVTYVPEQLLPLSPVYTSMARELIINFFDFHLFKIIQDARRCP